MKAMTQFSGKAVALPRRDVDTDQIIPARFLKVTSQKGLGKHAFSDWRYLNDGPLNPEFSLNRPEHQNAQVLVVGENFGCGSSREHAPWSLLDYGFRAVVGTSFADIFKSNALRNGLLIVEVDKAFHQTLISACPTTLAIDVDQQTLCGPDNRTAKFELEPFARHCLLNGIDTLEFLLAQQPQIQSYEEKMS